MRKLIIAVLAATGVLACDSAPTGAVPAEDAGNYVLQSMNDSTLPYVYTTSTTQQLIILSDTIFMGVDGRFADHTHTKLITSGVSELRNSATSGTWSERNSTITFLADDGSVLKGSLTSGTLLMLGDGRAARYTR